EARQKDESEFGAVFKKTDTAVDRFFSWLKNIMASDEDSSSPDVVEIVKNRTFLKNQSVPQNQVQSKSKIFVKSEEPLIHPTHESMKFDDVLSAVELRRQNDYSGLKKTKSSLPSAESPFRYIKRKKKFMDSYAGRVEKISPISRVHKV
ncbi:MAG: hypothetical protein HQK67_12945, partial [Desulfamplus sp.]|nr:hypothetical protein [Desulfamplus sp.]